MRIKEVLLVLALILIQILSLTMGYVIDEKESLLSIDNFEIDENLIDSINSDSKQIINGTPYESYIIEFREKPLALVEIKTQQEINELEGKLKKETEVTNTGITGSAIKNKQEKIEKLRKEISIKKEKVKKARETQKQKLISERSKAIEDIESKISPTTTGNSILQRITGFFLKITGRASEKISLKIENEYYNVFNGISLKISNKDVEKIKNSRYAKAIYPNLEMKALMMDSIPLVGADEAWEIKDNLGRTVTGKNVTIAIIDTGVDYTHLDLGGCFGTGCKVFDGYNFVISFDKKIKYNKKDPIDDNGHGTHVAGIAAGSGQGGLKGIAPDAKILAYKVLDSSGSGMGNWLLAAIERAVDPNQDGDFSDKVDIISMSLGFPAIFVDPEGPVSRAVDNAVNIGISAVVAAGNSGPKSNSIGDPGSARKAITVGATYKKDYDEKLWDENPQQDQVTSFSSRGFISWFPTLPNGFKIPSEEEYKEYKQFLFKPDIVAPGALICSARYDSIFPEGEHSFYRPCFDEKHVQMAGTSMATPIVSGAVALIKQAHPDWSPEEIKTVLKETAKDVGEEINVQGHGRIDIERAINSPKLPLAKIQTTGVFYNTTEISIVGSVTGENLTSYSIYFRAINNRLNEWELICEKTIQKNIENSSLCSWDIGNVAGNYLIKLKVNSEGMSSTDYSYLEIPRNEIVIEDDFYFVSKEKEELNNENKPFSFSYALIRGTAFCKNFLNYKVYWKSGDNDYNSDGIVLYYNGVKPVYYNERTITNVVYGDLKIREEETLGSLDFRKLQSLNKLQKGWYNLRLIVNCTDKLYTSEKSIYIDEKTTFKVLPYKLDFTIASSSYDSYAAGIKSHKLYPYIIDDITNNKKNLILTKPQAYGSDTGSFNLYNYSGSLIKNSDLSYYPSTMAIGDLNNDSSDEIFSIFSKADKKRLIVFKNIHNAKLEEIKAEQSEKQIKMIYPDLFLLAEPVIADLIPNDNSSNIISVLDGILNVYDKNLQKSSSWNLGNESVELYGKKSLLINKYHKIPVNAPKYSLAVGDMNNDKNKEIVVVTSEYNKKWTPPGMISPYISASKIFVFDAYGNLISGWPIKIEEIATETWYGKKYVYNNFSGVRYSAPILADIDNDNKKEIIIGNFKGIIYAWNDDGTNVGGWPIDTKNRDIGEISAGDVDNDGNIEIAFTARASGGDSSLFVYKNNGEMMPNFPVNYSSIGLKEYYDAIKGIFYFGIYGTPTIGNLDSDQEQEIIVPNYETIHNEKGKSIGHKIYAWNHDGTIVEGFPKVSNFAFASSMQIPIVDMDNDGYNEIILLVKDSIAIYSLNAPSNIRSDWPLRRHDPANTGCYDCE